MEHDDAPGNYRSHPRSSSREVQNAIGLPQADVADARPWHALAEKYLREALRVLDAQADVLELIARNVTLMLVVIEREAGKDRREANGGSV